MKRNATKHALLMSIISLLLCMSMLVGTTFAWFTDSVSSGNNIIAAGNLDIELEYWDGSWKNATAATDILTNDLWEPGVTEIAYLRIRNAGSLALNYQMGINVVSETLGKTKTGADIKLSDHIQFGVVEDVNGENGFANRDAAIAAVTDAKKLSEGYAKPGSMMPGEDLYLALVVYMPTTVGNEANHDGANIPKINLGINVFATQKVYENDSFGPEYDADAENTVFISTVDDLIKALTAIRDDAKQQIPGATGNKQYRVKANFVLADDLVIDSSAAFMYKDSNGAPFHFYGVSGVFDFNGHTITVTSDALLAGKSDANAVFLFQYSNMALTGKGGIVAENKSIPVYAWANCTVDIYNGSYITNAYERNESSVYVNNATAKVNVYGGTYTNAKYAFNVHDNCGNNPVIVLHEGITYADFLKNGVTDVIAQDINNGRIVFADNCSLEEYVDNGVAMNKVVAN